jgi:SAM-dependent methyltransferase
MWRDHLPPGLRKPLGRAKRWLMGQPEPAPPDPGVWFEPDDIDRLSRLFNDTCAGNAPEWQPWRHAHMRLPAWFEQGLDPWGSAYRAQQLRLWQLLAGVDRAYEAGIDETAATFSEADTDALRSPGWYGRRDAWAVTAASDHWLGTGMLLKHSGLKPGDRALEYGAGFGQTALAMARLGVQVDTVDISAAYCRAVQQQADFFQVPLQAHQGHFGFNPRPGEPYQLVFFYESFHHCLEFDALVGTLKTLLAPGGRVVLGGEPIVEAEYAAVPYPWGLRLHSETVAVVRQTRWMELGFSEAFLMELFRRHGFNGRRVDCEPSVFGRLYVFELE